MPTNENDTSWREELRQVRAKGSCLLRADSIATNFSFLYLGRSTPVGSNAPLRNSPFLPAAHHLARACFPRWAAGGVRLRPSRSNVTRASYALKYGLAGSDLLLGGRSLLRSRRRIQKLQARKQQEALFSEERAEVRVHVRTCQHEVCSILAQEMPRGTPGARGDSLEEGVAVLPL